MARFNPLVETLAAPPIPSVFAWAAAYDGRNGPMIDLSQAVPGYPPHPEMLRLLGENAASRAYTGYGPIQGEDSLRYYQLCGRDRQRVLHFDRKGSPQLPGHWQF